MGCNGGWLDETMDYAKYTGIESERAYPINVAALQSGVTPNCQDSSSTNYKITGYAQASDETTSLCINRINVLYNMYSMTTAMHSGFSAFQFYESGLFTGCPAGEMDHAVQFVGFYLDTESGYAHFKLKNSYGTGWGYGGYFYMAAYNLCHICEQSYYSF
jgi:C1A family cysteine protease